MAPHYKRKSYCVSEVAIGLNIYCRECTLVPLSIIQQLFVFFLVQKVHENHRKKTDFLQTRNGYELQFVNTY